MRPSRVQCLVGFLATLAAVSPLMGCDTADAPAINRSPESSARGSLRVAVDGATRGDFLYDAGVLPAETVFTGRLVFEGGAEAELRSARTDLGVDLTLEYSGLTPDSVTVNYLADGVPVAPPLTYRTVGFAARSADEEPSGYSAGTASTEPTSYHYVERNGEIVVVKDYNGVSQGDGSVGVPFTTARGEQIAVTDVSFTLYGVESSEPASVELVGAPDFQLRGLAVGR